LIRAVSKVTDSENLPSVGTSEIPLEVSIETRDISPYVAEVVTDDNNNNNNNNNTAIQSSTNARPVFLFPAA
jgi:hypothetical protein